jgi:hypothetical protein
MKNTKSITNLVFEAAVVKRMRLPEEYPPFMKNLQSSG